MDEFDSDGIVNPESRVRLASAGIGMDASYEGALMSEGSVPQAARAFIQFLASEDARPHWLAAKLDPALRAIDARPVAGHANSQPLIATVRDRTGIVQSERNPRGQRREARRPRARAAAAPHHL